MLIGAHGPHMITSLFLSPDAGIIELFPYGIDPDSFAFIKYMAGARGQPYTHLANLDPDQSIGFPNK